MKKILSVFILIAMILSLTACGDAGNAVNTIGDVIQSLTDKVTSNFTDKDLSPLALLEFFRSDDRPSSITSADGSLRATVDTSGTISYSYTPNDSEDKKPPELWWKAKELPEGVTFDVTTDGDTIYVTTNVYPDVPEGLVLAISHDSLLGTYRNESGTYIFTSNTTFFCSNGTVHHQRNVTLHADWFYDPAFDWIYDGESRLMSAATSGGSDIGSRITDIIHKQNLIIEFLDLDSSGHLLYLIKCSSTAPYYTYGKPLSPPLDAKDISDAKIACSTILFRSNSGKTYALYNYTYADLYTEKDFEPQEYIYLGDKSIEYYENAFHDYFERNDVDKKSLTNFFDRCSSGEY